LELGEDIEIATSIQDVTCVHCLKYGLSEATRILGELEVVALGVKGEKKVAVELMQSGIKETKLMIEKRIERCYT